MSRSKVMVLLAMALVAWGAQAQVPVPTGDEIVVRNFTFGGCCGGVALDDQGRFMVVWDEAFYSLSGASVSPQDAVSPSFQLDPFSTSISDQPVDVTTLANDDFAVVWEDSGYLVWGRRYASDGTPRIDAFEVSAMTNAPGPQQPTVARRNSQEFLVAWAEGSSSSNDLSVNLRLFDTAGVGLAPFQVDPFTPGDQDQPVVTVGAAGTIAVAWRSDGSLGSDNDGTSVHLRPFSSSGQASPPVQANALTLGDQERPHVAVADDDTILVVWQGPSAGSDPGQSIQGRLFGPTGVAQSGDFQINTATLAAQNMPHALALGPDDFLVTWTSRLGVRGRMVAADGGPMGVEFGLNVTATSAAADVAASRGVDGTFVVSWTTDAVSYPFTEGRHARRFALAVFADGFESGDVMAWDSSLP